MRRAYGLFWLCLCVLLGQIQVAHAAERVSNYDIELSVDETAEVGRYRVTLEYQARPPKKDGFKFFGDAVLSDVRVQDQAGAPMEFQILSGFAQQRVNWKVPEPDAKGRQTVRVSFQQKLQPRYGWRTRSVVIPWAHQFKIPVDRMTVTTLMPGEIKGPGCSFDGTHSRCSRSAARAFQAKQSKCRWRLIH